MIGQIYLHSINLNNDVVCHNFALPAPLSSSLMLRYAVDSPTPTLLYECDPDDLFLHPEKCLSGMVSPVASCIYLASSIRRNSLTYNGLGNEYAFSEEEKEHLLFKSEFEITCEKIRKNEFPTKPSRLSSIFLVEDNDEGKVCLRHMFIKPLTSRYYRPLVLTVKVTNLLSYHKGDVRWFDEYKKTLDKDTIRSYWDGALLDSNPLFEYFLEGTVVPTDREQINELRKTGNFFPQSPNHWRDLSDVAFCDWFGRDLIE